MTQIADESGLLKLDVCPRCEYSFATLPSEGTCPECGSAYDQRYIVLTGRGRGRWDTIAGGTWRGMVGQVLSFLFLFWVFGGSARSFLDQPFLMALALVGIVSLAAGAYARLFSDRKPAMQLWLSPEGFTQIPSTKESYQAQWFAARFTSLVFLLTAVAIVFSWRRRIDLVSIGVALVVVSFLLGQLLWDRLRTRRAAASGTLGLHPWASVRWSQIKSLSRGRVRIRFEIVRKWGPITITREPAADIEGHVTAAQADRLRDLIEMWRGRS